MIVFGLVIALIGAWFAGTELAHVKRTNPPQRIRTCGWPSGMAPRAGDMIEIGGRSDFLVVQTYDTRGDELLVAYVYSVGWRVNRRPR